jgi:hypothetical protein
MKEIEIISEHGEHHKEDIRRIKNILIEKGYNASMTHAEMLWDRFSSSMAAGWMILPESDDEVFNCIRYYLVR